MVEQLLQQLGLSEKEISVYLELLKQGKTTPAHIAKATKINRSTVYAIAKELIEKGIVYEDIGQKITHLAAKPTEELEILYEKDRRELERKKKITQEAIRELEKYPKNSAYSIPRIRFIEEEELEDFLYKEMKKWNDNARQTDGVCWGFQDHTFAEQYKKWILWANKTFKLKVNLLSNDSTIEHKLKKEFDEKREIIFWKKNVDFSSSIWIMGDYLIMIITRQKPHYLVEINDIVLAHNLREIFKQIWKEK